MDEFPNLKCGLCGTPLRHNSEYGEYCPNTNCKNAPIIEDELITDSKQLFSEESLKSLRGVPTHKIIFGTESKGRVVAEIPINVHRKDAENIVKELVDILKYGKEYARSVGLDVQGRGEKSDG